MAYLLSNPTIIPFFCPENTVRVYDPNNAAHRQWLYKVNSATQNNKRKEQYELWVNNPFGLIIPEKELQTILTSCALYNEWYRAVANMLMKDYDSNYHKYIAIK